LIILRKGIGSSEQAEVKNINAPKF